MKKKLIITLSIIFTLILLVFLFIYFTFLHHYKGNYIENNWSANDEFKIEDIKTIEKEEGSDFIILNLADIQLCDLENFFNYKTIKEEIDYLVDLVKPNLITLTGDQTWSNENLVSLKRLIRLLDSYKIYYAPVFGNHDYGNSYDSAVAGVLKCSEIYESGKYSLFSRGPSNLGTYGNYAVNIVENKNIYKTLYFIDAGYNDEITEMQSSWFKWIANGIKEFNNNEYSEGMVFMHKPLPEYRYAFYNYLNDGLSISDQVYVTYSLNGLKQTNFFDILKEANVKDVVCGHQHGNSFTLNYEGINLTFALKTGELGGYFEDENIYLNGATTIILNNDVKYHNIYVDKEKYHIK